MKPTPSDVAAGSRSSRKATDGLRLFARYAYAPNALGHCGPPDPSQLLTHLRDGAAEAGSEADGLPDLQAVARAFDGPLPYLQVIAEAAGIDDPFDARVVEAYWIGSDLLDVVDPDRCADALVTAFTGQPTVDLRRIEATRAGAVPHHAYHVLVTYPWIELVAAGRARALDVLDQCLIRTGTVIEVADEAVAVQSRHLELVGGRIVLGAERPEVVTPLGDGVPPQVGSTAALHWGRACASLGEREAAALERTVRHAVAIANAAFMPTP